MVLFPSPKSFLFRISLRRHRLKRSSAFFRRSSLRSRTSKATSSLSRAHSRKRRLRENEEYLPEEVVVEILLRLPVKSLLRFMCVCKSWLSLISSPLFTELHFQRSSQHSNRVIVSADGEFQSIDFNAPFRDDSAVVKLNFPLSPKPADLEIMGSCRGFLFLVVDKEQLLFLWNPSNDVCRMIPPVYTDMFIYMYGFAYDESTDDYLLILIAGFLACFSLKTKSWEILDDVCEYVYQWDVPTPGTIFNGAIHWFASRIPRSPPESYAIIAFDIKAKTLREIPVPEDFEHGLGVLGVVGGCLTLTENRDVIKMWVMKEYGVKSSWTKLYTISANEANIESIMPLCLTKDGQLVAGDSIRGLSKLNDRGEVLEHLEFSPRLDTEACASLYTETLLSLP